MRLEVIINGDQAEICKEMIVTCVPILSW